MDYKTLCLSLVKAETEEEVINILKEQGYWDNERVWQYYGDNENNYSDIGNQQSSAEAALVEKIINSVDAVLTKECHLRKIEPTSQYAPQTLEQALYEFFGIYKGQLTNVDPRDRRKLAENIGLVATGSKTKPSYIIYDFGEGQTPLKMPDTFLSLSKSNKLRIPFVQGKFNKGSTGALQFCGKHNLQLILSRRNPIIGETLREDTRDYWGFTVVRRAKPEDNARNSSFKYLAPNGNILSFKSDELNILPGDYPDAYSKPMSYGSFIKLYEYQLKPALKTIINFDLSNRLSLMLPSIALPITLYERRKLYKGHSMQSVLNGLSVRLDEDTRNNIETGFPNTDTITVLGEDMKATIYVFKEGHIKKYAPQEGVIFVLNGQSHGYLPRSIFSRKSISLDYLKDDLVVLVECSSLSARTREDLFMVSRDRLRDNELKNEVENVIEEMLKNHPGLKSLNYARYQAEKLSQIDNSKPIINVIQKIIDKHPELTKLLTSGTRIRTMGLYNPAGNKGDFKGKKFPTYFRLVKTYLQDSPKGCNINKKFRIEFETDAQNDYFDSNRGEDQGFFTAKVGGKKVDEQSLNLWNGIATLTVKLPVIASIGDLFYYETSVTDSWQQTPFINSFYVKVLPAALSSEGGKGERIKQPGGSGNISQAPMQFRPPDIRPSRKADGDNYKFKEDEYGALIVNNSPDGGYIFYLNLDNPYLKESIKPGDDKDILEVQFSNGMSIIALALLTEYHSHESRNSDQSPSLHDRVSFVTKAISPFFIPMIQDLQNISNVIE